MNRDQKGRANRLAPGSAGTWRRRICLSLRLAVPALMLCVCVLLQASAEESGREAGMRASAEETVQETELRVPLPDLTMEPETGAGGLPAFEYTCLRKDIPASFCLAAEGRQPTVRSQGSQESCWAITACSALESALLPQRRVIFSPDHMIWHNGYDTVQEDGGDYYMIMSYLADWKGPVTEEEDPYGDGVSPDGPEAAVHVEDMRLLKGMTHSQVKQTILTYGAVQSSLSMDRMRTDTDQYPYYSSGTAAYYDPVEETLSHDVLILGWDDAFSRENFRIRPQRDGAWICQNTWGEDFGEDGIFYVSYEDRNLLRKGGIAYSAIAPADGDARVYEQDSLGWLARQGYGSPTCWMAGVFRSPAQETMTGVGFYTTGPYTAYQICLVQDYTGPGCLQAAAAYPGTAETGEGNGDDSVQLLAAGKIAHPGYHTIHIPGRTGLRAGQQYAVAVRITTWKADNPIAVEMAKDIYTQSVVTEGRETYISPDGVTWENTQESTATNVCLKVYTEQAPVS